MTTLMEYIDHHASRFCQPRSRRAVADLHELKTLAYWLRLINDRRKLAKAVTAALLIAAYEIPLQAPAPTPAPVCIEYCSEPPAPMPPLLAAKAGTR